MTAQSIGKRGPVQVQKLYVSVDTNSFAALAGLEMALAVFDASIPVLKMSLEVLFER